MFLVHIDKKTLLDWSCLQSTEEKHALSVCAAAWGLGCIKCKTNSEQRSRQPYVAAPNLCTPCVSCTAKIASWPHLSVCWCCLTPLHGQVDLASFMVNRNDGHLYYLACGMMKAPNTRMNLLEWLRWQNHVFRVQALLWRCDKVISASCCFRACKASLEWHCIQQVTTFTNLTRDDE